MIETAITTFIALAGLAAIAVDRQARARAWRQIANERKWNWEHRERQSQVRSR